MLASDAPAFGLQVITDRNQNIRLQLGNCRAITGAGCRIELINQSLELSTNLTELLEKYNIPMADELQFLVVLSVDLFVRQPEGIPANNEPFPRPPFSVPTYRLNVVSGYQYEAEGITRAAAAPDFPSASFESYHLVVGQLAVNLVKLLRMKRLFRLVRPSVGTWACWAGPTSSTKWWPKSSAIRT